MENVVAAKLFSQAYKGRRVLVTGHTGFKGSWLCYWLHELGAEVCGFSNGIPTSPSHFQALELEMRSDIGDIKDLESLKKTLSEFKPEIVFHLAAQPLVRLSYREPIETFQTNIIGSVNVYEACRLTPSVKSIVSITTDKVYENNEWEWGYRENDRLGGVDPYSSSKAAMEIVTSSFRDSYFNIAKYGQEHEVLLATARAGNVIGGGDWALDRLIPDVILAACEKRPSIIRRPHALRPWQHVLEPLSGYLSLGEKLINKDSNFSTAFNFGPITSEDFSVLEVISLMKKSWGLIDYKVESLDDLHEAGLLKLDCSKALSMLKWKPVWNVEKSVERTVSWYRSYYENQKVLTSIDLKQYVGDAVQKKLSWVSTS